MTAVGSAVRAGAKRPVSRPRSTRRGLRGFGFVLPALAVLLVFQIGAIAFSLGMSTTDWSMGGAEFIGLENYATLLTSPVFFNSVIVTLFFVIGTVPVILVLAVPLAFALHYRFARFGFYRVLVFLPFVVPSVAAALIFQTIFGPTASGLANSLLAGLGLEPVQWLIDGRGLFNLALEPLGVTLPGLAGGPSVALVVTMGVFVWQNLGFAVIVLMSALVSVDESVLEAARLDGAGRTRMLTSIVLPLIRPTMLFVTITLIIMAVREFNLIYILTGGGPFDSSQTLLLLMIEQLYDQYKLGLAAATAFFLAAGVVVFSIIQFRVTARRGGDDVA